VHAQVDKPRVKERKGLRIERALPLWTTPRGLIGKVDVVDFEPDGTPYPVEYKHGSRNKAVDIAACDDVQLAAQALCLEAMAGHAAPEGALLYATSKRRRFVPITPELLAQVATTALALRAMLATGKLPPPTSDVRCCKSCSLGWRCQPEAWARLHDGNAAARLFDPDA
jgi:CRISPR-associated exonuclease Cas4